MNRKTKKGMVEKQMVDNDIVIEENLTQEEQFEESQVKDQDSIENNEADEVQIEEIQEDDQIVQLREKYLEKENLAKDYLEKLQRTLAEYDNFRKRTLKERTTMYENGAKEVLEKILPVMDNFGRALQSISEQDKESSLAQGIDMIFKQLNGVIKDLGVEEIEAVGKEFDPNLHHAVAHEENDAYGENQVIEVLQSGYIYKERTLRCSMVRVAN